jgi:two-component system, chemotaxis family, protein-glutamate methylesterase/glutaminase
MYEIVVIGTSWGGLNALTTVVSRLPGDFALPVTIVQHRHRASEGLLRELLQDRTTLHVCEVEDKAPMMPGTIYIAPADYHVLIEPGFFSLTTDPPVRYSRPSIDVTFISAADAFAERTIGVVLTGANEDGAVGLRRVADRGGRAIVQDPETAESPVMPRAALAQVPGARVLPLEAIPIDLAMAGTGPTEMRYRSSEGFPRSDLSLGDRELGRRDLGGGRL